MADFRTNDSRVNLPAIFVGALAACTANTVFVFAGTGLAMTFPSFSFFGGVGLAARILFSVVQAFVMAAVGGYVAGYYSGTRSLLDARLHGLAAVALAGLLFGLLLSFPGNYSIKSFTNGIPSSAPATLAQTQTLRPTLANGLPRGRVFLFRTIFSIEGILAGAWAGGMAYSRARRRSVELTGETRAA